LILNAVGGGVAAEIYPADICGVQVAGADELTDDCAGVGVAAGIYPADVCAVAVFVGGVDAGSGLDEG
jgi:hypothetical protein